MKIGLAFTTLAAAATSGWHMVPAHWALAAETPDHLKKVAAICGAEISLVVAVREARVPPAFEFFGLRFAQGTDRLKMDCVISQTRITKQAYISQQKPTQAISERPLSTQKQAFERR